MGLPPEPVCLLPELTFHKSSGVIMCAHLVFRIPKYILVVLTYEHTFVDSVNFFLSFHVCSVQISVAGLEG